MYMWLVYEQVGSPAAPPTVAGPSAVSAGTMIPAASSVIGKLSPSLGEQGCIQTTQDVTNVVE